MRGKHGVQYNNGPFFLPILYHNELGGDCFSTSDAL